VAAESTPRDRRARVGRLDRAALTGVLVREIVNFSSYWRATTFSSTVEPTIYLLAFGFGFGTLVSEVNGLDYVEFVGTGTVATAVLFSSVFPAMFGTFVKYQFQKTYDAILAAPVDTRRSSPARRCGSPRAPDLRLHAARRRHGVRASTRVGHARRPVHRVPDRLRLGVARDHRRGRHEVDRQLQLRHVAGDHAAVPRGRHVLPDRRPARVGADRGELQPAVPLRRAGAPRGLRLRARRPLPPRGDHRLRLIAWRLAIKALERKLIA
jgi:hypothetical protein